MIDPSKETRSLADFKRNTSQMMTRLKETGDPVVLTVNGKAEIVVQDAVAYQRLLEEHDERQALAGIRRGLDDVRLQRTRPARQALGAIRRKHDISPTT
ncbi:MAG TPA: type II toxin-antitoxin system Phd/YefM family antitoxin [Tepidisphaeraceae bacterium]|nr:type II toxin-antitoxin system Phd/YefM family antitoxin [Tepidisphaeraceae bacterium]